MLKKIIRSIVFIIMVFIPLFVYANDYTSELDNVNRYILRSSYNETYYRYLLDGRNQNIPFEYNRTSNIVNNEFKFGGMISKDEYLLTKSDKGSWIYNGSSIWTSTKSGGSHYTISYNGVQLVDDLNTSYRSKATEYVKLDAKVSGTGSVNDPWIFEQMYKVHVEVDPEKGTIDSTTNDVYKVGRCTRSECTANISATPATGLIYISNTCGGTYDRKNKTLRVNNITRDLNCEIRFGVGLFKLELKNEAGTLTTKVIYVQLGEGFYDSDKVTIIKKINELPTKPGYDFKGYDYEDPDTKELIRVIDSKGDFTLDGKESIKDSGDLKPNFSAKTYVVTFNPNGGVVSPQTKEVTFDRTYGELPLPTRVGYTFDGWIDEYNHNIGTGTKVVIPKDHVLKATWKPITYKIAYTMENGTHGASHPTTATYDTAFTLNTPTKSLKLTFNTSGTPASVNYSGAGVSGNNQSVAYTFNGWNISGMDTVTHYFGSTTSTAPTATGRKETSYKNLRSSESTVTFNAKWAKVSVKLPQVSATGYTCKWTSDQYTWASGATYETSADNGATARTFNASCTASAFTVDYNANGGSGNMTSHTCTYDQACTLKSNSYTRTGYKFIGWKKDNSGTTYAAGGSIKNIVPSGTATFFAQWQPQYFNVAYNANGGTGTTNGHQCLYDQACTLASSGYKRAGYQFAGWKKENSGSVLAAGSSIKNATNAGTTVTYYAQWTQCSAGTYASASDATCLICPAGTYSGAGASGCTNCVAGTYSGAKAGSCTNCPAGTYSGARASGCTNCAAGTYSGTKASGCTNCPAGTYSGTKASGCTNCPAGTYSGTKASGCTNCAAGTYSGTRASGCTACPVNQYQPNARSSGCIACGAGEWTNGTGRTSCDGKNIYNVGTLYSPLEFYELTGTLNAPVAVSFATLNTGSNPNYYHTRYTDGDVNFFSSYMRIFLWGHSYYSYGSASNFTGSVIALSFNTNLSGWNHVYVNYSSSSVDSFRGTLYAGVFAVSNPASAVSSYALQGYMYPSTISSVNSVRAASFSGSGTFDMNVSSLSGSYYIVLIVPAQYTVSTMNITRIYLSK